MATRVLLCAVLLLGACGEARTPAPTPRTYRAPRAAVAPVVDGRLDEDVWATAPWSEPFLDIRGPGHPPPRYATRAKLLWDDEHLYVAAQLEEPHLQATFEARDSFIYQEDNDFEVFLDPDGDGRRYFELEVNALGTEWDLLLDKPYGVGGEADHAFDLVGLRTRVHLGGTLNDPSDEDEGWTLEIAIPHAALGAHAGVSLPPAPGDVWRMNFSRVQWRFRVVDGRYVRIEEPTATNPHAEDNWVWSPQGEINMHLPGRWGYLVFEASPSPSPGR